MSMHSIKGLAQKCAWKAVAVSVLLVAGAFYTWCSVQRADRHMREDLLHQAHLLGQTVNVDRVRTLNGSGDDLNRPEYGRLKEQLSVFRKAREKCRFFYIIGRRPDGTVFFHVDSEPPSSKDYSPPGQNYEEAPQGSRQVFDTRRAAVVGPFSDRWGTWVSAFVPLTDPKHAHAGPGTGNATRTAARPGSSVAAVLGMDVDAREWNRNLALAAFPPLLFTLAVATILMIGFALDARRSKYAPTPPRWMGRIDPALTLTIGFAATMFASWTAHMAERHNRSETFKALAASKTDGLVTALRELRDIELEGLASFLMSSQKVTLKEFQRYAHYLEKTPYIQAWAWAPAVPAKDMPVFAQEAHTCGLEKYQVWQKDPRGNRVPAISRSLHYPVFQVAPLEGNENILGFDLGSEAVRRAALDEAARTGLPTATGPVTLMVDTGNQKGILIGQPLYEELGRQRLRGFVIAVLNLESLLASTAADQSALMELNILSMEKAPLHLATSCTSGNRPKAGFSATRPVFAFGKVFEVTAHAGPEFYRLNPAQSGWYAALTALLLTGILAAMTTMFARRREDLEQMVASRTAELREIEQQFLQAQKMESVGRLAGGIAHDFNNMLGVIMGHAEIALVKADGENPLHRHLQAISKAAERSADLTRQLLAFARRQTIAPKVLDLNATLHGMLSMLQRLIGEDIRLAWIPGRDMWAVRIDPSQVDQILTNLCVNSRDAISGVGEITIETSNAVLDGEYCAKHSGFVPGEYVWLAISDDGCGMDKETVENIFDPFFTTKETGKGTGLGLATVYGIVKQNNGFINVYSEPGQGTAFNIYLPRHADLTCPAREQAPEPLRYGSETILLVEDEPEILEVVHMMLRNLGYAVIAAQTAQDAVRQAGEHPGRIHLLITDVIMPDMNGRELAQKLTALLPNLACMYMSGYTADVIARRGVLDNGVLFIQKPFSAQVLAVKVREALDSPAGSHGIDCPARQVPACHFSITKSALHPSGCTPHPERCE